VISEVLVDPVGANGGNQIVEITNVSGAAFNPAGWQICAPFTYGSLANIEIPDRGVVRLHLGASGTNTATDQFFPGFQFRLLGGSDTFSLYVPTQLFLPDQMRDFVSWGGGQARTGEAVSVGLWPSTAVSVTLPAGEGKSIARINTGNEPGAWIQENNPTLGSLNLEGTFSFGTGCAGAGGVPTIDAAGAIPSIDSTFSVSMSNLPPVGMLDVPVGVIGFSDEMSGALPLPLDLGLIGMTGCTLYASLNKTQSLVNNNGSGTWDVVVPNNSDIFGFHFFLQLVVFDSSIAPPEIPLRLSNAIDGRIGN
jgi:hypothetical protein